MQLPQHHRRHDHHRRNTRRRDIPFPILWRLHLLPHDQGQPRLHDVGGLIHRRRHQGALLVIVGADLVRPREAQAAEAGAAAHEHEAGPLPPDGDVPDGEARVADDVHHAAEEDGRPARAVEDRVGGPGVGEGGDHLPGVGGGGVDVDLPDFVLGVLGGFEVLGEDGGGAGVAVVEGDVEEAEEVDVPGGEDAEDFLLGVGGAAFAAFEGHAFAGEGAFGRRQVEGARCFGDVGKDEESGQGDREGDDAVDEEEPLPAAEAAGSA